MLDFLAGADAAKRSAKSANTHSMPFEAQEFLKQLANRHKRVCTHCIGHNCIGHYYVGKSYTDNNYIGHN